MNILMLTPRFPYPPTRGDAVRAWGQLEYLAHRHDVWLACVDVRRPQPAHLAHVRKICPAVAVASRPRLSSLLLGGASLLRGRSITEGFYGSHSLVRTLQSWTNNVRFDAVLTFSSAMAPYADLVRNARRVLDMNDVDSHKWMVYARRSQAPKSWLFALEGRRLAALESRSVRAHDVTLVVNQREQRRLVSQLQPAQSDVVRTSVDATLAASHNQQAARTTQPNEPIIGSIGSMFYPPNVRAVEWFGQNVWPHVRRAVPEARWLIVGNRPVHRVRRWASQPGVTVTGFVPDIRPHLDTMRVFINPVDGDIGVQTKLLCALAAGKAAVVTPDTAAGIDFTGSPPFLIAREPIAFARAVIRLLSEGALAEELSVRARQLIAEIYEAGDQLRRVEQWLSGTSPGESPSRETQSATNRAASGNTSAALCEVSG